MKLLELAQQAIDEPDVNHDALHFTEVPAARKAARSKSGRCNGTTVKKEGLLIPSSQQSIIKHGTKTRRSTEHQLFSGIGLYLTIRDRRTLSTALK